MKNLKKITAVVLFASFFLLPTSIKSQVNCTGYLIKNSTGCDIIVDYNYRCPGVGTCSGGVVTGKLIPAGQNYSVPTCGLGCTGTACDIGVTLQSVGGNTTGFPVSVGSSNTSGTWNSAYCAGSSGTIVWTAPTDTTIQ